MIDFSMFSILSLLNQQVLQAAITWKQCTDLPTKLASGRIAVINGKVYCGGDAAVDDDYYIICCYDPSQDNWTTLPPLPVRYFGLGEVNGKLVAIGGRKKSDCRVTNVVYTFDERSNKWKRTIPPMPTARDFPGVLSFQSALVVVGGAFLIGSYADVVEIFKLDTLQWYTTDSLPTACSDISLTVIGSTCYALGGYNGSPLNQTLYASVDDLLHKAVPANQTTHSRGSSDTLSAWKILATTPTYRPAAAVLAGGLLSIGGDETSNGGADQREVYVYSPSTHSWIYISDLPAPRSLPKAAVLSSTEILAIGGWCGGRVNSVYKGTLQLKL